MAPASRRNRWRWCCSAACAATNACTGTASAWRSCRTWCAATAASSTSAARPNSAAPASKSGSLPACDPVVGAAEAAKSSSRLQRRRPVQLFQVRRDLRHRAAQQLRVAEVVFAAYREELLGRLGGVGIEQGAAAAVHLAHEGVVRLLEVARPFALPGARQRRGAVEHAVERIELVR